MNLQNRINSINNTNCSKPFNQINKILENITSAGLTTTNISRNTSDRLNNIFNSKNYSSELDRKFPINKASYETNVNNSNMIENINSNLLQKKVNEERFTEVKI